MLFSKSAFAVFLISLSTLAFAGIEQRDSPNNRCGSPDGYSCNSIGQTFRCCSRSGYCGNTASHCGAGCQSAYGICGTATVTTPATPNTVFRGRLGDVVYGQDIYSCITRGDVALTFDDGPWLYTSQLLDILRDKGVKATFFITGNNLEKGAIDDTNYPWARIIKRAYDEGHQIASHTWDHLDLDLLSEEERIYQMTRLEQAMLRIVGRFSTYMRPPYIRCSDGCRSTMNTLGYHVIIWDLDTDDYNNDNLQLIQYSKDIISAVVGSEPRHRSFLSVAHDIHWQTVVNLTSFQIDLDRMNGYRHVRLGECLGDPEANWYRTQLY